MQSTSKIAAELKEEYPYVSERTIRGIVKHSCDLEVAHYYLERRSQQTMQGMTEYLEKKRDIIKVILRGSPEPKYDLFPDDYYVDGLLPDEVRDELDELGDSLCRYTDLDSDETSLGVFCEKMEEAGLSKYADRVREFLYRFFGELKRPSLK